LEGLLIKNELHEDEKILDFIKKIGIENKTKNLEKDVGERFNLLKIKDQEKEKGQQLLEDDDKNRMKWVYVFNKTADKIIKEGKEGKKDKDILKKRALEQLDRAWNRIYRNRNWEGDGEYKEYLNFEYKEYLNFDTDKYIKI